MEVLDQERQRITTYLKQRGYYNFTVNNISMKPTRSAAIIWWT